MRAYPFYMNRLPHIRRARPADAAQISALVQTTLRISNAQDYPPAVIDRVVENFSPAAIRNLLDQRCVMVASDDAGDTGGNSGDIIGTASLEGDVVRTMFVAPEEQGRGIGRGLMAAIEDLARDQGIPMLRVPASLTATAFYARLGYRAIREVEHGDERTVVMEKVLS